MAEQANPMQAPNMPAPNNPAAKAFEECTKELRTTFFPPEMVKETLKKFKVPEDKWKPIESALAQKDIFALVKQKAAAMNPNPLNDQKRLGEGVKLVRETLLQVFGDTLKANGITDEKQIEGMLSDIQHQKSDRLYKCAQEAKEKFAQSRKPDPQEDKGDEDEDQSDQD